mmetsp:Transcript_29097/g.76185  ORF Transcript_29097/g.76185 Transcript_29097/m.76185 type:complete len:266 (-) Transcript_29097:533-1330(-)
MPWVATSLVCRSLVDRGPIRVPHPGGVTKDTVIHQRGLCLRVVLDAAVWLQVVRPEHRLPHQRHARLLLAHPTSAHAATRCVESRNHFRHHHHALGVPPLGLTGAQEGFRELGGEDAQRGICERLGRRFDLLQYDRHVESCVRREHVHAGVGVYEEAIDLVPREDVHEDVPLCVALLRHIDPSANGADDADLTIKFQRGIVTRVDLGAHLRTGTFHAVELKLPIVNIVRAWNSVGAAHHEDVPDFRDHGGIHLQRRGQIRHWPRG